MTILITEIKPGVTFEWRGNILRCVKYDHIKWAQQARIRLKMKNLRTGSIVEDTFNVGERFEPAHISYRPMQYLYNDGNTYHFMDQENFNQIELAKEKLGDTYNYLKDGFLVNIAFYGDEALEVTLPAAVELKVVETSPGNKGDTVSGGKPATMETGLVVSVPFFVNAGDVLKVDTRDGKYLGRA
ncbi:MAG: elongation factor P [Candidatus Saganbacteria bacterium]|uniref:Elongation factor P n=1 Tax=Candidatus Saganbacteria bacterium TaxID=2575572 RepID=A0A833L4H4_UNCSA|nr:MAG: elongation factor P [Candidatus Saganbacteria bacterium]